MAAAAAVEDDTLFNDLDKLGFPDNLIKTIKKSKKIHANFDKLTKYILKNNEDCKFPEDKAKLLYCIGSTFPTEDYMNDAWEWAIENVLNDRLSTLVRVQECVKYFKKLKSAHKTRSMMEFNASDVENASGIHVSFSEDDIKRVVAETLKDQKECVNERRYQCVGTIRNILRKPLMFADHSIIINELNKQLEEILGPKTEEDLNPSKTKTKKKKSEKPLAKKKQQKEEEEVKEIEFSIDDFAVGREIESQINTEDEWNGHINRVGDGIRTRFPPEPNGYLHLGHAKAINFNFGVAEKQGGVCLLRFDDTNPAAEKQEYIDNIIECVKWLGFTPHQITFSSDHFQKLYELAIKLIKLGKAYVCHQTGAEIKKSREEHTPSPYRDRSVEDNLRLFDDMKCGKIAEGVCTLRMKQDIESNNPNMYDLVAYRVKMEEHPRSKDEWCIYPSYDFTHCIIDSLEDITHSLCTLEFETRRESYYWLLDTLGLYKPKVWEYSRLNIQYNVLSKRKLLALVNEKHVNGWDDPRLMTLMGLKRRGFPPEAVNLLCKRAGVSRTDQMMLMSNLESCARDVLDPILPRHFIVHNPLKVILLNYDANRCEMMKASLYPQKTDDDTIRELPLTRVVYIDRKDFRMVDDKTYYGLAPNKSAYLKYAYAITVTNVQVDPITNEPTCLEAAVDFNSLGKRNKKIKGYLHWISEPTPNTSPHTCEVRQYGNLFNVDDPARESNWRQLLNKDALIVHKSAMVEPSLAASISNGHRFQGERQGYYIVDPDTTDKQLVLNRTLPLKSHFIK